MSKALRMTSLSSLKNLLKEKMKGGTNERGGVVAMKGGIICIIEDHPQGIEIIGLIIQGIIEVIGMTVGETIGETTGIVMKGGKSIMIGIDKIAGKERITDGRIMLIDTAQGQDRILNRNTNIKVKAGKDTTDHRIQRKGEQ